MFARLKEAYRKFSAGEPETFASRSMGAEELSTMRWDHSVDVAVAGFGGAGAAAALEAASQGAEVAVIDRFTGGGSTNISGGIFYAGGGTTIQQQAGVEDSPDNMYRYLSMETGNVVSEETLREFCQRSPENLQWLMDQGVPFDASACPYKTSYPSNLYYYYYSGNESFPPYSDHATPAARGHRAHGPGVSGATFFKPLQQSVMDKGIKPLLQHKVVRVLSDQHGRAIGLEMRAMTAGSISAWLHRQLSALMVTLRYVTIFAQFLNWLMRWGVEVLERHYASPVFLQARQGVIISSGGFYFNRTMVAEHAPAYLAGVPLGTIGDDGSGIKLGQSLGGSTGHMDNISAWRFMNPPASFIKGVLVDQGGQRICNEMLYGAQLGERIMKNADGKAWLIIDQALFKQAHGELGPSKAMWFQSVSAIMFLYLARKRGKTLEDLGRKLGIPPTALQETVAQYNALAASDQPDAMGKPRDFITALGAGPYYALDCSARSLMMCPTLTLGGLRVDESTGHVLADDGSPIEGLYAAGRSAVGIASHSYVSGLSLADCIFSGRRAGRHAAQAGGTAAGQGGQASQSTA